METNKVTTNIITKIEFFDFMRAFFTDDKTYQKLTQSAKKPHLFMWRRMMSIQYPVQMHVLAMLDDIRIVDVLHKRFLSNSYPRWMYTSTQGGSKEAKEKSIIQKYDRTILDMFMDIYKIEYKTVVDLNEFNPKFLDSEMKTMEEALYPDLKKDREKAKKIKK